MSIFSWKKQEKEIENPYKTIEELIHFVLFVASGFDADPQEYGQFAGKKIKFYEYPNSISLELKNVINFDVQRIYYLDCLLKQYFDKHIDNLDIWGFDNEVEDGWLDKMYLKRLLLNKGKIVKDLKLPDTLNSYHVSDCELDHLPEVPESVTTLVVSYNNIERITSIPKQLTYFSVSENKLKRLPTLPINLTNLMCSNNQLTELPYLPFSLERLECGKNKLKSLSLPPKIKEVRCEENELKYLNVPISVETLWCWENDFEEKPDTNWNRKNMYFTLQDLYDRDKKSYD